METYGVRAGRVAAVVVLTLLLVVGGFFLAVWWPESSVERWVEPPEVSSDDRAVRITVLGGMCDHPEAEVDENADSVTITVRVVEDWFVTACGDAAVPATIIVELDEPLGDRTLVDGAV